VSKSRCQFCLLVSSGMAARYAPDPRLDTQEASKYPQPLGAQLTHQCLVEAADPDTLLGGIANHRCLEQRYVPPVGIAGTDGGAAPGLRSSCQINRLASISRGFDGVGAAAVIGIAVAAIPGGLSETQLEEVK
jgi:hypothetical protein